MNVFSPDRKKKKVKILAFSFFSTQVRSFCFSHFRSITFSILFLFGGILSGFLYFFNIEDIKAATFGWVQESWGGGISATTATHANNQSGWTAYESKTGVTAGDTLSLIRESN